MGELFWVVFVVSLVLGLVPAAIASSKGKDFLVWYLYGFFLFFFAMIHAIVLPENSQEEKPKQEGHIQPGQRVANSKGLLTKKVAKRFEMRQFVVNLKCPVDILSCEVTVTEDYTMVYANMLFCNLSPQEIKAVQLKIKCYDSFESPVNKNGSNVFEETIQDISVPPNKPFGDDNLIELQGLKDTRIIRVVVARVLFSDDSIWNYDESDLFELALESLSDDELYNLTQVAGTDAVCYFRKEPNFWQCICGRANFVEAEECIRCKRKKETVMQTFSSAATVEDEFRNLGLEKTTKHMNGNSLNSGLADIEGDFVYFRSNDGGLIYRMRDDGSDVKRLNNNDSLCINVENGWLYFRNNDDGRKIYRMRTDGTGREKLNSDNSGSINIVGDWIYYKNNKAFDTDSIYRIHTAGSNRERLNNDSSSFINVMGDWIYYSNELDGNRIYKMRTDGSDRERLNSDSSPFINVVGNWMYYSNDYDGGCIYRMRTNGSNREKLSSERSGSINVVGDWIYYSNKDDGGSIYRMRTNGTGREKLNNDSSGAINIVGDWVYYKNFDDEFSIYRIRTNGTDRQRLP